MTFVEMVFAAAKTFPERGLMDPGSHVHYSQPGYDEMGRVAGETIAAMTLSRR